MILLDFSQIALASIIVQKLTDENTIRMRILNSIRMYNKRHRNEYGQMVICVDARNTWRKEYFPQYKQHRKKNRAESDTDWTDLFRIIDLIREEIQTNLPYKVIHVDGAEGDDVIATLAMDNPDEKHMIISSDKDFIQLQKYKNVKQFSPIQKKNVTDKDPTRYLLEHVLKGDAGDGIPNVLSPDNSFVDGIRQSPLTQKKIASWSGISDELDLVAIEDKNVYRNFQRNRTLIDLECIPGVISTSIINTYNEQKIPHKMKVLNYLIQKRCKLLVECVDEFYNQPSAA